MLSAHMQETRMAPCCSWECTLQTQHTVIGMCMCMPDISRRMQSTYMHACPNTTIPKQQDLFVGWLNLSHVQHISPCVDVWWLVKVLSINSILNPARWKCLQPLWLQRKLLRKFFTQKQHTNLRNKFTVFCRMNMFLLWWGHSSKSRCVP